MLLELPTLTAARQLTAELPRRIVRLLPHQDQFVYDDASAPLLLDGGFGAAKTMALCAWGHRECQRFPHNQILIGREEYSDLADSTIKSFFDLVDRAHGEWNEQRKTFTYSDTNSEILFRHLSDFAGLRNLNLGGAGVDQAEESKPEMIDLLIGRLRRPKSARSLRLTANPNGHDFLWQLFYGPGSVIWQSPHCVEEPVVSPDYREGYRVIRCTTKDNIFLPPDYLERMLKDYPPEYVNQYVFGSREITLSYRFFDQGHLAHQRIEEPVAVGYFVDGLPRPEFREQVGGPVRLYERYSDRDLYVLGLDIATGEGFSRSAGVCVNGRMNQTAAVIDADLRPDELAVQGWLMSRYYGNALIAPERNGIGFSVVIALQQLTSHLFTEQVTEFGVGKDTGHLGWLTDARSRMELFAQLQREIAYESTRLKDRELIEQAKAITMTKGKPKAEAGFRDDLVMARGIAGMVRKLRLTTMEKTRQDVQGEPVPKPEMGTAYGFGNRHVRYAGR